MTDVAGTHDQGADSMARQLHYLCFFRPLSIKKGRAQSQNLPSDSFSNPALYYSYSHVLPVSPLVKVVGRRRIGNSGVEKSDGLLTRGLRERRELANE